MRTLPFWIFLNNLTAWMLIFFVMSEGYALVRNYGCEVYKVWILNFILFHFLPKIWLYWRFNSSLSRWYFLNQLFWRTALFRQTWFWFVLLFFWLCLFFSLEGIDTKNLRLIFFSLLFFFDWFLSLFHQLCNIWLNIVFLRQLSKIFEFLLKVW